MLVLLGLITGGLLGASLFTTGMIFNKSSLVIAGITITSVQITGMGILYLCAKKPQSQLQIQGQSQNTVIYSSNNMNTMKRNKSDTDLELISRQSEEI